MGSGRGDPARELLERNAAALATKAAQGERIPAEEVDALARLAKLRFTESAGELRLLQLEDNQIGVRYHGRVRGMTVGSGEGRRSLMPTHLDWMRARHGISLLWGIVLSLFGLIAGVLRWWGIRA